MPQGSTRISKALTNFSVQYKNDNYIAGEVLKTMNVLKESDQYWIHNSKFKLEETYRENGSLANMATFGYSTSSYKTQEHALKDVITENDRANTDAPLNLDRDATEYLTDQIMLRQEYDTHKLLFTTTTWGNNSTLTSATSWKYHTTTSAPIQNVLSATGLILESSVKRPNKIVVGWDVFAALKENPNMYNRLAYTKDKMMTSQIMASMFDLDMMHVGSAVIDSAQEGDSEDQGFLWGADALIGWFDPSPGIKKATAALMFRVARKGIPYRVKKWYQDDIEGDFIEVQTKYVPKAVATACAYLYKSVAL